MLRRRGTWMNVSMLLGCLLLASACEKQPDDDKIVGNAKPGGAAATLGPKSADALRIAVVPKGTTHEFWKSVHAGAVKAQRELNGVEITFRGPDREDDREQQIALLQNLQSGGYDAIVLAPLDQQALVAPVKQVTAAGIPVVIIDSGLQAEAGKDFVSFVATDNHRGGELAGESIAKSLNGQGKVLLLRYMEGSESTMQREQGCIDALKKSPGITIIDPGRYAGATRATAQEAAENLLTSSDARGINAVFCPNESSTYGMLLALRSKGLVGGPGKVTFVGFDSSPDLVSALQSGDISALVVQNPLRMGYLGVKTAVEHIRGSTVEKRIDTGVALVTKDNMQQPEIAEALNPPLAEYLGGN